MNSKIEFIEAFKKRTKLFAVHSIKLFNTLPKNEEARIIGRQFLRSSTSMAANYRASCRARSKAEYFTKLSITAEEADETPFWLELFVNSEILTEKMTLYPKERNLRNSNDSIVSKKKHIQRKQPCQLNPILSFIQSRIH